MNHGQCARNLFSDDAVQPHRVIAYGHRKEQRDRHDLVQTVGGVEQDQLVIVVNNGWMTFPGGSVAESDETNNTKVTTGAIKW